MASVGLNIGLRALLTAQTALDTVGHNIANANTPGYSRQRLNVTAARPLTLGGLQLGGGVEAGSITRASDALVTRRIVTQVATVRRLDAMLVGMQGVEALLGEPGGFGLGGRMSGLFDSFAQLSGEPEDVVFRSGVVQSAAALGGQFRQLADELSVLRDEAASRVEAFTQEVNVRAREILDLNREIAAIESSGGMANDQRDQREVALEKLAEQIDVTYHEDPNGALRVLVGGQLLVGHATVNPIHAEIEGDQVEVFVAGGTRPVTARGGEIGGFFAFAREFAPQFAGDVDQLARNLIFETNRVHSVGIPADGGFQSLRAAYALEDVDGDGALEDELLTRAGLPFDVRGGVLYVNVSEVATGDVATHTVELDPERTTVGDLMAAFDAIDGLSASLDPSGRLVLTAAGGRHFDFARRLNERPDGYGTFGGGQASHASANQGPFDLTAGSTLTLAGPVSNVTVTFGDLSQASAQEVADAINAEPGMATNLLRAVAVGEHVVLQTVGSGAGETFTISGGTALANLGFTAGTVVTGHDAGVAVEIEGSYSGGANQELVFRALSDGAIGTTPGLAVRVETADGAEVATLNVGEGYVPGTALEVLDGVRVSFGFGELSATDGDLFAEHLIADSDTTDVLAALGLNAFFVGADAATIDVRADLAEDPLLVAASATGALGDNGILLDMQGLQTAEHAGLGASFGEFYGALISGVGSEVSATESALEVEEFVHESLVARRDEVSGVNLDEELVDMIQYEQAYGAASRFIQVVNTLHAEVLNLL